MNQFKEITEERENTHGDYGRQCAITRSLKRTLHSYPEFASLEDYKQEALDFFCVKMGRILAGNSDFHDHWADIGGYASETLEEIEKQNNRGVL